MVRQGRNGSEKDKEEKKSGPHLNKKNNINFIICEQYGLKYEIVLFINAKNSII